MDGPVVVVKGFSEPDGRLADESLETLDEAADIAISNMKRKDRFDDDAVERAIGRALRKAAETAWGMRPMIEVVVLRT
jgi:ribonuclease J